ncbi:MAG: RsmG family class I SAM-dependent methyltransferase, partial [Flammeovirgaceae bacterium]
MQDVSVITKYFPQLTPQQQAQFAKLGDLYREWNDKINVISRKDVDNLYVNHVLHSLGIAKVMQFRAGATVLDVGTG